MLELRASSCSIDRRPRSTRDKEARVPDTVYPTATSELAARRKQAAP